MNIEQLTYICEVAKTGSFTKAAQSTHITLSAISQSISSLETELGVSLFTRSRGSGAVPTIEGQVIISKASEIIHKINDLKEEAKSYSDILSGELKIATIPGPMHLLVNIVSNFKKDFPNVKIELLEKGPKDIIEDIKKNQIDIGFIIFHDDFAQKSYELSVERLIEGKLVVGVSKNSPLALEKAITPEQLQQQTMVLYDDDYIRWVMEQFVAKYGPVDILFTSNNTEAIQNAVKEQLAVTVGLDYSFKSSAPYKKKRMVTVPLEIPDLESVYYGWVCREEKNASKLAKRFLERLKYEL
ncbi:LysR family transcriptional regulator [Bacillus massiliigorillae]|uniref:LysR family transcriptional regulator n=1 Tax=Bacillus massiliigorillae TaxID=1243664 RepID=UPI0003A9CE8B|nr:LysR family transcriptional regulator [Bacillus massiliigorillae]